MFSHYLPRTVRASHPRLVPLCPLSPLARTFISTHPTLASPTLALVARLRKETQCSISKAREALSATSGTSYADALAWLQNDTLTSGAKKAAKLGSRVAAEGVVHALCLENGARGVVVEVNAETDFVARSKDFVELVKRVGATTIMVGDQGVRGQGNEVVVDVPVEFLTSAPQLPSATAAEVGEFKTVQEDVVETIGKLGENIKIRRAVVTSTPTPTTAGHQEFFAGSYAHSGGDSTLPRGFGRIAALAVLHVSPPTTTTPTQVSALLTLANKVAQHIVGFNPQVVSESDINPTTEAASDGESASDHLDRVVLLRQPFVFGGGSVQQVLDQAVVDIFPELQRNVKLEVRQFVRWECGEGIEKKEDNFVEEVMKQAGL
ncbi:elongation factor TS-domain-containing protein [Powellomyces hirtus]|nr:elongation factor TS-domain-containing protein [Powellomyces hirtus]